MPRDGKVRMGMLRHINKESPIDNNRSQTFFAGLL